MRLVKCYIEGFGCYSKKEIEFDKDIHEICQNNGTGKSTLAAFIVCMFYGLAGNRVQDIEANDGKHYKPMQGGAFAGYLEFESKGKLYRIYRDFANSEAKLYEDGSEISIASEDFGMQFFKVDRDAFLRTIFINDKFLDGVANTSIKNLLSCTVEDGDYSKEFKNLEEIIKKITSTRAKDSEVSIAKNRIDKLNKEIIILDSETRDLDSYIKDRNALSIKIKEDEEKLDTQNELKATLAKWEALEDKQNNVEKLKQYIALTKTKYPNDIPSLDDLRDVESAIDKIKELKIKSGAQFISDDKKNRFKELNDKFSISMPTEQELVKLNEAENIINTQSIALSLKEEEKSRIEKDATYTKLKDKQIDNDKINELNRLNNEIVNLKKEIYAAETLASQSVPKKKKLGKLNIIIASIGIILMIAGIATLFFNLVPGIVLAVLGVIAVVLSVVIKSSNNLGNVNQIDNTKQTQRLLKEEDMKKILAQIGYYTSDPLDAYNELQHDLKNYAVIKKQIEDLDELINSINKSISESNKIVEVFCANYGYEKNNVKSKVTNEIREYNDLKKEVSQIDTSLEESEKLIAAEKLKFDNFIKEYGLNLDIDNKEWINLIRLDINDIESKEKLIEEKLEEIDSYKKANNLVVKPDIKFDFNLKTKVDEEKAQFTSLVNKITDLENKKETLTLKEQEKSEIEENKNNRLNQAKVYETVLNELKAADISLSSRFVEPVKSVFSRYANLIEKNLNEKMEMSKDYSITYEKFGDKKPIDYNSDGEKTIISLCLRLALIDNIFKDDAPFIVMDDPFNELDPSHMKNTKAVLKEISKEKQIIYMTCDPVRKIK